MFADKLSFGDEIRIIAPSRSLSVIRSDIFNNAERYLLEKGFKLTYSKNSRKVNAYDSFDVQSRVEDLQEAFADKNVKAIFTCIGGFNVNQILEYIDYAIIKNNPKILCGYSDITALLNAIYVKTGLVTYHGPHFSSFGFYDHIDYTNSYFEKCVMTDSPYIIKPSIQAKEYVVIQEGTCEGKIIGGNLCTLNLLQGTTFMPNLNNKVLFIEDDNIMGEYFIFEFERNLQSLLQQDGLQGIKGMVFGRFDETCNINAEVITDIVSTKKQLRNIPILYNVDFGHIQPFATFPIGGVVRICADMNSASIEIVEH